MEFNREEFNWTEEPVIGLSLLIMGGSIDSCGNPIKGDIYYTVGKHKINGKVVILPSGKNIKDQYLDQLMKSQNRYN